MNNSAGNDMYITGGAITVSEYEQNMIPTDQSRYEQLLADEFTAAYNSDPYKGNLDFDHWLKSLNAELLRERALKFEELKAAPNGMQRIMAMPDGRLLEDAAMIQQLAHLHTGRIEDLVDIVEATGPSDVGFGSGFTVPKLRRPEGSMPPQGAPPQQPPVNGGIMEGGGDQGPF